MPIDGLTIEEYEKLRAAVAVNHELEDGKLVDVSGNTFEHNPRDLPAELLRAAVRTAQTERVVIEQEFNFDGNAHGPDISLSTGRFAHNWAGSGFAGLSHRLRINSTISSLYGGVVTRVSS